MNGEKPSFTEISAVAVAAAFISAALYLYGMSLSLKVPVFDYMTTTDYLTFSIRWLTPTLATAAISMVVVLFTRRVEGGLTEAEIVAATKNPKRTARRRNLPFIVIQVMVFVLTVLYFIGWKLGVVSNRAFYDLAAGTLPVIWVVFAGWYLAAPRIVKNWNRAPVIAFIFLPALLILAFFRGLYQGELVLSDGLNAKSVVMEDRTINAQVVLTLDGYFILKTEAEKELLIVRRSQIKEIREPIVK